MDNYIDLTIAIPVLNEENTLKGCLEHIGNDFAKNIIVIDSGSTDKTLEIANNFGVQVLTFNWNGLFPKKRNWFLQQHTPATKWVLFLDADEYITTAFKDEVRRKLANEKMAGYWLSYNIYFLGKPLRGGYPLRKLALFKVGAGEYEKIEENNWSKLDMEVHEHPILNGDVGLIKSRIDHRDLNGTFSYIQKHNEYSDWEANKFLRNTNSKHQQSVLTWKQKLKYKIMKSPFIGIVYFFGSFIFMGGFIDGTRGLAFAILKMSYFTQVYVKIKEKASN